MAADEDDLPPSTSISKERAQGQDSRAVAHVGEDPDAPSTRITRGRGVVERIIEHERQIQHKDLTPEEVRRFLHPEDKTGEE